MSSQGRYNFLKFEEVTIRNFSLYSKGEEVHERINQGVYCLAGANGLGKTTFLNTINYALTGIVLEPNKEVFSPDDIVKTNKGYTERYFKGRIKAKDIEKAEVELLISFENKYLRIVRGFDNRDELRVFEFYEIKGDKKRSLLDTKKLSPKKLIDKYQDVIAMETGIGKFSYFLFYQLYVLTFDENRRMLFWDDRASNNALSIAFNDDVNDTDRLLELKSDMDKLESNGRNERWQATQIKNELERLIGSSDQLNDPAYKELKEIYFEMHDAIERNESTYSEINMEYDVLLKRQNLINSEILQLKTEYKKMFSQYSEPRSKLTLNPLVQQATKNNECYACNSKGHQVVENMQRKLYLDSCPVCDTHIDNGNEVLQEGLLKDIKSIDKKLFKKNNELEELVLEAQTKKIELDKSEFTSNNLKNELSVFLKKNSSVTFDKTGDASIDTLIDEYKNQYDKFDKKSIASYADRDKLRPEYDNLLRKVDEGYKEAKQIFVPLFKKIAKSFIGVDLNIYPKRKGRNFVLYFEMKDTARTASHQLSESQRFFLDIALRMALATHLSNPNFEATMLIDTPEGSLDIAYENRVGKMFAEYISEYNQNIIMTANINASQLLVTLARECGESKMKFRRMLEWAEMSDIQKEGEHLFNEVYDRIENTLKNN